MIKKAGIFTLACGALAIGCNNINNNVIQIESEASTEQLQENIYHIDVSLDTKEHTFKIEDERPIIEAFTEARQGMSPQAILDLFMRCGNASTSETYTDGISEYEMFDIRVTNNENEEVSVTYKDGSLISKRYRKDIFDNSNKNTAFVNYKSNLFKQDYSSGIYREDINKNIAENKNVWEIEEDLFKIFN